MKIRITETLLAVGSRRLVVFDCPIGTGAGIWAGSTNAPPHGLTCEVEFDVVGPLEKNETIFAQESQENRLDFAAPFLTLYGCLENLAEDGVGMIRLSPASLLQVRLSPGQIRNGDWIRIVIPPDRFRITPCGSD